MSLQTPSLPTPSLQTPSLFAPLARCVILCAALLPGVFVAPAEAECTTTPALLVSSFSGDTVTSFTLGDGAVLPVIGPGTSLDAPLCARVGPDGLLYVASEGTNSVLRFDPCDGGFVDVFVAPGSGGLNAPTGLDWGPDGNLYVAGFNSDAVFRYDGQSGAYLSKFVATGSGGLNGPDNGMLFGPDGHLYVPSYWSNRVLRYDGQTGAFMGIFVNAISRPRVLVFRGDFLYITSEVADAVYRCSAVDGSGLAFEIAPGTGGLDTPIGLAMGPEGDWYVSSGTKHAVFRYDALTGAFKGYAVPPGTPGVQSPVFVTFLNTSPSADFDSDGDVDSADLGVVLANWGGSGVGDLTGDGTVGGDDLAQVLSQWTA